MNTKGYIVGAVLASLVWLLLWPDTETPSSADRDAEAESGTDDRRLPRDPAPLGGERRYGVAGASPSTQGSRSGVTRGTPGAQIPQDHVVPFSDPMERFTFRPLTEKEEEKLEPERPRPYAAYPGTGQQGPGPAPLPYGQRPPDVPEAPAGPAYPAYPQDFGYGSQPGDGYSFRPFTRSPGARNRWQGPDYQQWDRSRRSLEPWDLPQDPQWGSRPPDYWTPPAERMYPSLDWPSDRTLTAR